MTKIYFAPNTILGIIINYKGIANKRIEFSECTGGSQFITNDAELMEGIEHSSYFNHGFRLQKVFGKPVEKDAAQPEAEQPAQETSAVTTVTVASISEARDYLADNFGILKSNLRSKTAIMTAAAENHITFEGI